MQFFGILIAIVALVVPATSFLSKFLLEYTGWKGKGKKRKEADASFERTVQNLSSDNPAAQLAAAVMMRKYLTKKIGKRLYLHDQAINVISAVLRTLPTGVFQKTLADGLAYSKDLSEKDLQKTNLQDIYLGIKPDQPKEGSKLLRNIRNFSKAHLPKRIVEVCHKIAESRRAKKERERKDIKIKLNRTDLFKANLSNGLLDHLDAKGAYLLDAILVGCRIKNSDFSNASFKGADLTNAVFKNVILFGAEFEDATNIPFELQQHIQNNKCTLKESFSTGSSEKHQTIFFSMPGKMAKDDQLLILGYKNQLRSMGYNVIEYARDPYPKFGQLTHVKSAIEKSDGLIAFGTHQTYIKEGTYRPGMSGEQQIIEKWKSTPWNEVEVGMAIMKGIPVLLVKDEDLNDGIFDEVLSESIMSRISSKCDINVLDRNPDFCAWKSQL